MDVLEEFLAGSQAKPVSAPKKTTVDQKSRDVDRLQILQTELNKAQTSASSASDPNVKARYERDIQALQREISKAGGQPVVAQQTSSDPLESFLSGAPKTAETPAQQPKSNLAVDLATEFHKKRQQLGQTVLGAGEAGLSMLTGAAAAPLGALGGIIETVQGGKFGTQEGIKQGQQKAAAIQQAMTYQPRTEAGQAMISGLGAAAEAAKLPPVVPEAIALQSVAGPAMRQARQAQPLAPVRQAIAELEGKVAQPQVMTPEAVAQMQKQFAAKKTGVKERSVGASMVESNPYAGQITGEEAIRGQFPQIKLSKTRENVPQNEQSIRASIANEVLGDSGQVRPGVVTGNEDTLRTEYTLAKRPDGGPAGELLKKQIADEQVALSNYADQRVKNTGASENLTTPFERGERINDFFAGSPAQGEGPNSVVSFFRQEKQRIYDQARQQVGSNPITTGHVDTLLADPQFKAGLKLQGTEGVATGASELIDLAKTTGFKDVNGNFHAPNTIGAWDAVRKALNADWTPSNAKVIRKINRAIDQDIASAGGGDLLKMADSIHEAEKTIFGSKGIKNLFGQIDSNGVETGKVSFDAMPQRLNSMPFNEWRHIYDTADKLSKGQLFGPTNPKTGEPKWVVQVPQDVQMAAQSAKSEMLGNIAREIYQAGGAKAGVWNQNAVNKILNARADKIKYAFPLEEQQAFHKLNYAGFLMPGEHGYEGAAMQARRLGLVEGQLEKAGAAAGATVGGFVGGPTGAAVGGYAGKKLGARGAEKLGERAARKEAERLQQEMQKTSKLSDLIPK